MIKNMQKYVGMLRENNINISYTGPLWDCSIKGIAEMVKESLSHDDIPITASKSIFSVFIEQVTNMLMYSAEKEQYDQTQSEETPIGMLLLGHIGKTYFVQTGNAIKNNNIEIVKSKIDHLNSLDKKELRQYYKESLRGENTNPDSKGGGLGFIEVARRATAPIEYTFETIDENISYFSMYVEIGPKEG